MQNTQTTKDFIGCLDYNLITTAERVQLVTKLMAEPNVFTEYYSQPKHNSFYEKQITYALEVIADYMMAFEKDFPSTQKINKPRSKEVSLDGMVSNENGINEQEQLSSEYTPNYYTNTKQTITPEDFKDPELSEVLGGYKKYKEYLQKVRDKAKADKDGKLKYRCDKIIGEVNVDMIEAKNTIKKPICSFNSTRTQEKINWLDCDYGNLEQLKALVVLHPRRLDKDLGILTYDMSQMLKKANLTKTERKVINFIRQNDKLTQQEIAEALNYTQPYINLTIKNVAKKVQKLGLH
jgi:predicted XRE-type DNA-binding protein